MPNLRKTAPAVLPEIDPHHVESLLELDGDTLKGLWAKHFGTALPARCRKSLLVDCLAYRIQEQAFGGLSLSIRSKLRKLAMDVHEGKKPELLFSTQIKPGTRLIRTWGGETHEVQVLENGFTYRDRQYSNLSEIARAITGTRWSGPLFFGLRRSGKSVKEHADEQ